MEGVGYVTQRSTSGKAPWKFRHQKAHLEDGCLVRASDPDICQKGGWFLGWAEVLLGLKCGRIAGTMAK